MPFVKQDLRKEVMVLVMTLLVKSHPFTHPQSQKDERPREWVGDDKGLDKAGYTDPRHGRLGQSCYCRNLL